MPLTKKNLLRGLLLVLLGVGMTVWLDASNLFSRLELSSFDHRVAIFRSEKSLHDDVVIVLIDDHSLRELNERFGRWPWPRNAFAELIDFFVLAGAQSLAFDILFSEYELPNRLSEQDLSLVDATQRSGIAVHAMQLLPSGLTGNRQPLPAEFESRFGLQANRYAGPVYDDFLLPFTELYRASRSIGFLEIRPDPDGIFRRLRLFNRHRDGTVLSSLSGAIMLPLLTNEKTIDLVDAEARIGSASIPLDGAGHFLINPYGRVTVYPASQVIRTHEQIRSGQSDDLVLPPELFADKLVLLGASAIGLLDAKPTAMAASEPGVFLHAYTVSNLLQQDFLVATSPAVALVLLLVVSSIAVSSALFSRGAWMAVTVHLAVATGYPAVAYFAFDKNLVMPITQVLFAFFLSVLLAFYLRAYSKNR